MKTFMTIINEEKTYRELTESIRMMNSQRSDIEKINLIEEGKKIETHLAVVRGLPSKKFLSECVNEKSSTERRS